MMKTNYHKQWSWYEKIPINISLSAMGAGQVLMPAQAVVDQYDVATVAYISLVPLRAYNTIV